MVKSMSRSRALFLSGGLFLLAVLMGLAGQAGPRAAGQSRAAASRNDYGRVVSLELVAAPFPHRARQAGYSFGGNFFPAVGHYDDPSVTVFIPAGFEPRGRVDLVFFFHGWYSSAAEAARDFDLYRQFAASGARALLVLPETARDAPDSFGGKLEDEEGFSALLGELLARLHSAGIAPALRPGSITLVGHSGAYHVISKILAQRGMGSRIGAVCLFDALYEELPSYELWIQASGGRFVSICAEEGDPADNARALAASLVGRGIAVETAEDDPKADKSVLGHRVVFLTSPYDHNGLVSQADEFERVLAAGLPSE